MATRKKIPLIDSSADLAVTGSVAIAGSGSAVITFPSTNQTLVGRTTTDTLTNKTIDANGTGNSITNLEVADFASGVLDTDLSSVSATDNTIPSAKATKTALDLKTDKTNPYKVKAYLPTATQDNLVNNTFTLVNLTAESYDTNNNFDTSTKTYTVPVTGYYLINSSIMYTNAVANKKYSNAIYVDGVSVSTTNQHSGVADFLSIQNSTVLYLTSGQTVTLYARSVSGDNTVDINYGENNTYLILFLLSL